MKKATLEQELLSTIEKQQHKKAFVDATMKAIRQQGAVGTFERILRTTSTTKQESLIMKLKRLPRFALMSLAALGLTVMSGTAYAAYRLWTHPSVSVEGNVVKLEDCRQSGDRKVVRIDTKSGRNPEQVAQILKANCEISNVHQWATHDLHAKPGDVMLPFTVAAVHGDTLTITGDNNDRRTLSIGRDTILVVDGKPIALDQLKVGDNIAYVAPDGKGRAKAIVRLTLPVDYYRTSTQSLVITQDICPGNPGDLCRQSGGVTGVRVDMNGETASLRFADDWEPKVIEGRVVSYTDSELTIVGSSGTQYTIHTTNGLVAQFNADPNRNSGLQIMPGDTVNVQYRQPKGADRHMVAADELEQMTLVATGDAKADTLQKY